MIMMPFPAPQPGPVTPGPETPGPQGPDSSNIDLSHCTVEIKVKLKENLEIRLPCILYFIIQIGTAILTGGSNYQGDGGEPITCDGTVVCKGGCIGGTVILTGTTLVCNGGGPWDCEGGKGIG